MRRATAMALVIAAAVGCGPGGDGVGNARGSPAETPTETPGGTVVYQWVAVFDTAAHPDDLDPSTEELLDAAGEHVAVQPVQCWDGLAADLGLEKGRYAAAVIAPSEDDLRAVVDEVGREPVGTGRYRAFCLD